ncbi:hypothetical protein BGZ81_011594 [Podila clonocystis]|nr:hypothetical protein BGZ81_011594 [Podila clonocystis]
MLLQVEPVLVWVDNLNLTSVTWKWIYDPHAILHHWKKRGIERRILDKVSLTFQPGELTAILGASGAGKEDSFLFTHLTVRETLHYVAALSMDTNLTKSDRVAKVEAIMEFMGLLECADVSVGNIESTGISGGQRRRVSIALQLIIEPACLVLDEPTTALDAVAALRIVQTLNGIAQTGRTVICTIHQPRSAIWSEVDNAVVLMNGGRLGYADKAAHALRYFTQLGHVPPE